MIIDSTKDFDKDVRLLLKMVQVKLANVMTKLMTVHNLDGISNLKKMSAKSYYRIRITDYRIGFKLVDENTLLFLVAKHRREIYDYFPSE